MAHSIDIPGRIRDSLPRTGCGDKPAVRTVDRIAAGRVEHPEDRSGRVAVVLDSSAEHEDLRHKHKIEGKMTQSIDIPGRIRGALLGRPREVATYDDVLDARPRPLPPLAERLARRWKIKPASAFRRLESFLRDGVSPSGERVADILVEVGLTIAPAEDWWPEGVEGEESA